MIGMIVYRNTFLRIARVWFDETPPDRGVDIIYSFQRLSPPVRLSFTEFHTITVDLHQSEEAIFSKFKKDTRNEIRRAAEKDGIVCDNPSPAHPQLLKDFYEVYEGFAAQKRRVGADRKLLSLLSESQSLYISSANVSPTGKPVFHVYYRSPSRVRLLYSASLFRDSDEAERRNLIGRMNRCLHWNDMQWFKKDGVFTYDFGGWYSGNDDEEKLRINKFKEEFGGTIVKNYDCEEGVTILGRVALLINRHFRNR